VRWREEQRKVKHRKPNRLRSTDRLRLAWWVVQIAVWIYQQVNDR